MSFATGLSGLNAASNMLSVTGNNIANANTVGFKNSRSEFADVYASSVGGVSKNTPGAGVQVTNVAQQFSQGTLEFTDNTLDLAISGNGYFVLGSSVNDTNLKQYSRAGQFKLDKDGYIINNNSQPLLMYAPIDPENVNTGFSGSPAAMKVDTSLGAPQATTTVNMVANFDSRETLPVDSSGTVIPFDPSNSDSYNFSTSNTVYDSLGNPHQMTYYYVAKKDATTTPVANANQWDLYAYMDLNNLNPGGTVGNPSTSPPTLGTAGTPYTLTFSTSGALSSLSDGTTTSLVPPATISFPQITSTASATPPPQGELVDTGWSADPLPITLDFGNTTQYGSTTDVQSFNQDGFPSGQMVGLAIGDDGAVQIRFSNGRSKVLGKVALANFRNPQGLGKVGDTNWVETRDSGPVLFGNAGVGNFGKVNSGALESANVDIAAQLVKLIVAQQSYQANAQTISTENQVVQTVLNIR